MPNTGRLKDGTQHHGLSDGGAFGYVPIPGKPHIFLQTQQNTPSTPGRETQNLGPDKQKQIQVQQRSGIDQTRAIQEESTQHKGPQKTPCITKTTSDVSSSMVPDPTRPMDQPQEEDLTVKHPQRGHFKPQRNTAQRRDPQYHP